MSKYFIEPFAQNGNKLVIPDDLQTNGSVSYTEGFGFDYQRNLTNDPLAKPFPRQGFNGLIYDITDALKQYQEHGFFDFITPEMNGGNPFPYSMGAVVRYDMSDDGSDVRNFSSKINNNTGNPKDNPTDWLDITTSGLEFATDEETKAGAITDKIVSPAGLASVTSAVDRRGLIQLATQDEVNSGTNATKSVTPSTFLGAFSNKSLTGSGYQILPGGLIIQWARIYISANGTAFTFPIVFPNECFVLNIGTGEDRADAAEVMNAVADSITTSGFKANATRTSYYTYIAIGY